MLMLKITMLVLLLLQMLKKTHLGHFKSSVTYSKTCNLFVLFQENKPLLSQLSFELHLLMLRTTIGMLLLLQMLTEIYEQLLNNMLLIQNTCYLFGCFNEKKPLLSKTSFKLHMFMLKITMQMLFLFQMLTETHRYIVNHLLLIQKPVTYSAVLCSLFLIPCSNVKLVTYSLFLIQMSSWLYVRGSLFVTFSDCI